MRRLSVILSCLMLPGLSRAARISDSYVGTDVPAREESQQPAFIDVRVDAPKSPGYWHGYSGELGYVMVYSPNLELYPGTVFRAEWTMTDTWRALLWGRYVWVYR